MSADVVIVGGGVIGLSIAYRLTSEGVRVVVLDRREMGREASWAGAGLLPANAERIRENPTVELRSWSAVLFAEWSARLREETGIDNGYRRTGGVDVALTEAEAADLHSASGRWKAEGIVFEHLARADHLRVEPGLGPHILSAYFLPDRAQVRNPWHLRALAIAARKRGAELRTHQPALGFETREGRAVAVRVPDGTISCGAVVIAAGAWSERVLTGLGVRTPTPPVKGQIVLLRGDRPLLRRIVEHGKNYLVPREDGRILVGATEENAGFDTRPTAVGARDLLGEALRLCPGLAEAEVEQTWAGLRPGSFDTRPYLGPVPGYGNVYAATGHKRAGLQLSPATAELLADLVMDRRPRIDLRSYRLDREPSAVVDETFRS